MGFFEISQKDKIVTIKCPTQISAKAALEFSTLSQGWINDPQQLYILDFASVKDLDPAFYRPMVLFHQGVKTKGSFVSTVNANSTIVDEIRRAGLDTVFSPKVSLKEALEGAGIKTARTKIDVEFINPFIQATKTTIETQANTLVKIGKPHLKSEGGASGFDIAGVLSLTSEAFQGSIALCFPAKVFLLIYSNMLGEKHEVITKEIEDAAGELLNIIFGQAKAVLNDKNGFKIQKAIPTIVRGASLEVHHLSRIVAVILPFETEAGSFHLEVSTEAV